MTMSFPSKIFRNFPPTSGRTIKSRVSNLAIRKPTWSILSVPSIQCRRYSPPPPEGHYHVSHSKPSLPLPMAPFPLEGVLIPRSPLQHDPSQRIAERFSIPKESSPSLAIHEQQKVSTDPTYDTPDCLEEKPYWRQLEPWKEVSSDLFLDYRWQIKNTVQTQAKLYQFLTEVLPERISGNADTPDMTRDDFLHDVTKGMQEAPMAVRLTPHILSVINWADAYNDPIRRQFMPMKSQFVPDHPSLELDSLHESKDSPTPGLVHRYPDKALFLATSVCPVYCRYCTRSYSVGSPTENVQKNSFKPTRRRWEAMFDYIESTPALTDIVVSGGDSYYLQPENIVEIGERLLGIPHIRRIRFASKGLAVCPSRILDPSDTWARAVIDVSAQARKMGKSAALHTHFNHPNEITWVTRKAANRLYQEYLTVRNQTVLLKGVNDNANVMSELIRSLADMNIQPYYVYQGDMVKGVEDLRTPLRTILDLESQIRGTIAGFMMPQFVVDLPQGGGKRLATSYESYVNGVSKFLAPAIKGKGKENKSYYYYDPQTTAEEKLLSSPVRTFKEVA